MKKILALGLVAMLSTACNAKDASTVEKDVFTSVQVACVLENATLGNAQIATACGIAESLIPGLETILAAHRQGVGVPKPAACGH